MIPFVWRDGVQVAGTPLFCDALRARSLCFLSHAGRAPGGRHRQLLSTEMTARLLATLERGRAPGATKADLLCPYGRPFSLGTLRLELFPSGYLPGAASLLITQAGGQRPLVYAGDLNPRSGLLCEPMQLRAAEALVCHAPLAALLRSLPERAEAEVALRLALSVAHDEGACAVVLAPELGLAQDLQALLRGAGVPVLVHPRIARYGPVYAPALASLPSAPTYGPRHPPLPGTALLWPLDRPLLPLLRAHKVPLRLILCAGAALSEDAVARYRRALPAALPFAPIPFPDGIDLPGLLRYVAQSEAREVYLTAGASEPVERALAARGVRLVPLGPPRQLELFTT